MNIGLDLSGGFPPVIAYGFAFTGLGIKLSDRTEILWMAVGTSKLQESLLKLIAAYSALTIIESVLLLVHLML